MVNIPCFIEFFTKMASAIFTLLLGKLLFDQTNSLWAFASAYGGEFVIVALIQIFAGSAADKYSPTKILLLINALSCGLFFALAQYYQHMPIIGLFVAAAMVYVARPFYRTSLFVLIRSVNDKSQLATANGRMTSSSQLGQIIGLSLTGWLLSRYSEVSLLQLMTSLYAVCLVLIFVAHRSYKSNSARNSNKSQPLSWRDFFQFSQNQRAFLVRLTSSFSIALSLGGFYVLLAPLVAEKFANNSNWLSSLSLSYALGAITSGIAVKRYNALLKTASSDRLLALNQGISSLVFFSCGLFPDLSWLPVLLFLFGSSTTFAAVSLASYLQSTTLDGIAGRTAAAQNIIIAMGNAFVAFYCSFWFSWSFQAAAIALGALIGAIMLIYLAVLDHYPQVDHEKHINTHVPNLPQKPPRS